MINTKIIAYYLPQYHEIPENNEWWGKGFTDWTTVRQAKPLFKGHYLPREPLNDNYYDLLNKDVMKWQAELAAEAGIYGFCFYHYWFKGKQLLERPVDNYLKWTDIPQKYCFCWANDSWKRTWSAIEGNDWYPLGDGKREQCTVEKRFLIKQTYGDEEDWKKHFEYLLPFFKDSRYIRIDNKPVFSFFQPVQKGFPFKRMVKFWQKLAIENGLDGIYIIANNVYNRYDQDVVDALSLYEPSYTRFRDKDFNNSFKQSYKRMCKCILNRTQFDSVPIYYGALVGQDESPRRGIQGKVMVGSNPIRFEKFLEKLLIKMKYENVGYLFLTAWNEWGESAYLEPDKKYKYGYLEAVKKALINTGNYEHCHKDD